MSRTANVACVTCLLVGGAALAADHVKVVRVAGGSMVPTLWPGDVCLVTEVARPSVSDIVLLAEPGHVGRVLHRVQAVHTTTLVTQGDANPVPDLRPIPRRAVLGRVSRVLPVGRLVSWWQVAHGR